MSRWVGRKCHVSGEGWEWESFFRSCESVRLFMLVFSRFAQKIRGDTGILWVYFRFLRFFFPHVREKFTIVPQEFTYVWRGTFVLSLHKKEKKWDLKLPLVLYLKPKHHRWDLRANSSKPNKIKVTFYRHATCKSRSCEWKRNIYKNE